MKKSILSTLVVAIMLLAGMYSCTDSSTSKVEENVPNEATDEWASTAETPETVDSEVPLNTEELFAYLSSKKYQDFKAKESANHPSAGPHTKLGLPVRVFMNDKLAASMEAGADSHPVGSSIIKEMYTADNELDGWAVMVKTHENTDEGRGWFWYEVTSATDMTAIAAVGNGVVGCYSCHNVGGSDMIRTAFPMK